VTCFLLNALRAGLAFIDSILYFVSGIVFGASYFVFYN